MLELDERSFLTTVLGNLHLVHGVFEQFVREQQLCGENLRANFDDTRHVLCGTLQYLAGPIYEKMLQLVRQCKDQRIVGKVLRDHAHWKPETALWRKDWMEKPSAKVWRDLVCNQWRTRDMPMRRVGASKCS